MNNESDGITKPECQLSYLIDIDPCLFNEIKELHDKIRVKRNIFSNDVYAVLKMFNKIVSDIELIYSWNGDDYQRNNQRKIINVLKYEFVFFITRISANGYVDDMLQFDIPSSSVFGSVTSEIEEITDTIRNLFCCGGEGGCPKLPWDERLRICSSKLIRFVNVNITSGITNLTDSKLAGEKNIDIIRLVLNVIRNLNCIRDEHDDDIMAGVNEVLMDYYVKNENEKDINRSKCFHLDKECTITYGSADFSYNYGSYVLSIVNRPDNYIILDNDTDIGLGIDEKILVGLISNTLNDVIRSFNETQDCKLDDILSVNRLLLSKSRITGKNMMFLFMEVFYSNATDSKFINIPLYTDTTNNEIYLITSSKYGKLGTSKVLTDPKLFYGISIFEQSDGTRNTLEIQF